MGAPSLPLPAPPVEFEPVRVLEPDVFPAPVNPAPPLDPVAPFEPLVPVELPLPDAVLPLPLAPSALASMAAPAPSPPLAASVAAASPDAMPASLLLLSPVVNGKPDLEGTPTAEM